MPERYDQNKFMSPWEMCGCIAFHSLNFLPKEAQDWGVVRISSHLDIPLFTLLGYSTGWIHPFATDYADAETPKERARVGYRRIVHYCKTGE